VRICWPHPRRTSRRFVLIAAILTASLAIFVVLSGDLRAAPQAQSQPAVAASAPPRVVELRIGDEVEPLLAEYIVGGIDQANRDHAALVLITMDTPGGLQDSMQQIIQRILSSPVPVVVYVWPTASRAASAGFFILLSADVAAMAPGTHTGAASPLLEVGGVPVTVDETLKKKILNDATAFLRSYAEKRGRNTQLAETAVTDAKAFSDVEAKDGRLVDIIASSPDDLLAALDGRTIKRFDGSTTQLNLRGAQRVAMQMSFRQRLLARIVQPDAFFILLIFGALGLYIEFTHPGAVLPGVAGAIAMVLALYAMQILPVNFAGVLLMVAALVMFILEAKYSSHGVLGVGGVIAMLLGALMLIHSPLTGAGVSIGVALGVTVPFALLVILLMRLVLRSRTWKLTTGPERLVGATAEVTESLATPGADGSFAGMVRTQGALWRAVAPQTIPAGVQVRVVRVAGLTLHVIPAAPAGTVAH
jgi:membrane-bound serine protease (ClpP class)